MAQFRPDALSRSRRQTFFHTVATFALSSREVFVKSLKKLVALVAVATATWMAVATSTQAQSWNTVGRCYQQIEGVGTGRGVFGLGTAKARTAARIDWQQRAEGRYGPAYARLSLASGVRWDCKKNAVLLAKCVVTAKPCGARIRG